MDVIIDDKETAQRYSDVVVAFGFGEKIEFKRSEKDRWLACPQPRFMKGFEYRVKPAPVEVWGNYYEELNEWFFYREERQCKFSAAARVTRAAVHFVEKR